MKRYLFIIIILATVSVHRTYAQYYSINYDTKTVAAMAAAFGTEVVAESYYNEQVAAILKHYSAAEVATAGIFASKFLERKALTDLGIWSSATENYYYRRIYHMVANKIIPKIWIVAGQMLRSPHNAIYWGSYLVKICDEVKTLCMQFESVVTNSTLSFKDVIFLEFKSEIAQIFRLSEIGNIDWERFFNDLSKVPNNFNSENLKADIDHLYRVGANLASAGITNLGDALLQQSNFHELINGNVSKVKDIYDNYSVLFEQLEHNTGNTLLALVGGKDNVAGLFQLSDYNLTSWMTDYLEQTKGNYYTQRWYIARRDQGTETLCDYYPPTDDNSILNGSQWVRFNTSDASFYPNAQQREQVLSNSESYAGWSRSKVNNLNSKNDGYNYTINYYMSGYLINKGSKLVKKAYAYEIHVYRSWNNEEVVYEDYFDSYTMDLNTFKAQMNAKLSEYNENEEGYVYYLESDSKNYYQASDEMKLQGCETVTISVTCSDGALLGQGSTQYKCRQCGGSLNAHSKSCAMTTTISENDVDLSELHQMKTEADNKVSLLQTQINQLETENKELLKLISEASIEDAVALRQRYNQNKDTIDELRSELTTWQQKQSEINEAMNEAAQDNDVATDDYYRIPAIMQDCKIAYNLTWQDNGNWSGYTFIRKATMPNINGIITFSATLKIARKPKYFLGIKIHRAILQINWELTSEYSQTHVAEVITLNHDMSEAEKKKIVNDKISEIARQYPNCKITTEYSYSEPIEEEPNNDVIHLLWSSDRLEIAREVDSRITKIYADLVSLEKMMHYKRDIVDVLKDVLPPLEYDLGRRKTLIEECHDRWIDNAKLRNKP